ncbi:phage major capsid protein [uncultured Paraglaciecola sp.]|uniref:phage major capsid protein n=1 Tax=uncultured Paraglaciecola sp. TaxID=1765024 RepID=UPI002625AD08|nr:phage major capsid protein [uncultured Paraglaciecola sp.]
MNAQLSEEVQAQITALDGEVKNFINKTNEEVLAHGKLGTANKEALKSLEDKSEELQARLLDLEQKATALGDTGKKVKSAGEQFVSSAAFEAMKSGSAKSAKFEVQNNTITGSDTTVAPDRQIPVVGGAVRRLRVQDVLPQGVTGSNAIEFTREATFTNSAAEAAENTAKAESALTFSLVNVPVRTIAHWIKLSKQVIDDAPMLASYVDGRMQYGVALRLDNQLVNGDGTGANISGILDAGNFTAFTSTASDTATVSLRKAITQVQQADYQPTAVILNPADVQAIDLDIENTSVSLTSPRAQTLPTIWGVPIVASNAIASNTFALGAFDMSSELFIRSGVMVELFEQDDTNAQSNLVTMRAEMRAALATYRAASVVGGTLTS